MFCFLWYKVQTQLVTAKDHYGSGHCGCHPGSETYLHNYTYFVAFNTDCGQLGVITQVHFRATVTGALCHLKVHHLH